MKNFFQYYKRLKKLNLGFLDVLSLTTTSDRQTETRLFDRVITINSPFWYMHGLEELFLDETYKFNSKKESPLILDCGANIGLSIIYFKQIHPKASIIAFEPDKLIFKMLKKNLKAFGYNDVELINKAVWSNDTPIQFMASGGVGGRIQKAEEENGLSELPAVRLNNYLDADVDFLKIDIEGAEYEVICDCKDKLRNVRNIFIEYHSEENREQHLGDILKILKHAGFKYYLKEAWVNQPFPYVNKRTNLFDLQLNIFGYRIER